MSKEVFETFLRKRTELNDSEIEVVCNGFNIEELKRGDILIKANSPLIKIAFIVEGVLKAVDCDPDGSPVIHYFIAENHWISEPDGLYRSQVAKLTIQAATPCTLLTISIANLEQMLKDNSNINLEFHKFSELELIELFYAKELTRKATVKEKYLAFIDRYSSLQGRVRANDIACYLGISKYSLSRIKKEYQ